MAERTELKDPIRIYAPRIEILCAEAKSTKFGDVVMTSVFCKGEDRTIYASRQRVADGVFLRLSSLYAVISSLDQALSVWETPSMLIDLGFKELNENYLPEINLYSMAEVFLCPVKPKFLPKGYNHLSPIAEQIALRKQYHDSESEAYQLLVG